MKTHYELLDVERTADVDTIKRAFRREIARYHPDKVMHLGAEFQEMAATRAAALTAAYKSLIDPLQREIYDRGLATGTFPDIEPEAAPPERARDLPDEAPFRAVDDEPADPAPGRQFEPERAGRDTIVRRAVLARVQGQVERQLGAVDTPVVRGFDLALVPRGRPRFLGRPLPRALVRVAPVVDGRLAAEAWAAAVRARVGSGRSPVVVVLVGDEIGAPFEITQALDRQRRRVRTDEQLFVVLVDVGDWSVRVPPDVPAEVRKLARAIGEKS